MPEIPNDNSNERGNGIDRMLADAEYVDLLRTCRIGLLTNDGCRLADGRSTLTGVLEVAGRRAEGGLACLFAPEHGPAATRAAGAHVEDARHAATGLPVISLYGARLAPQPAQLTAIDILVVDLRDVGVRCYTYAATAALATAAALSAGKRVIVCDRPNPLGPRRDGPWLDPALRSLMGYFDTPFVHGRTLGELVAGAVADHPAVGLLTVIAAGIEAAAQSDTWIAPSPALASHEAMLLYPGLVLFENANVSEGRGTPHPFTCLAAPWLAAGPLAAAAAEWPTGVDAQAGSLTPEGGLYAAQQLPAVRFAPRSRACDGLALGVYALSWITRRHPQFAWRTTTLPRLGGHDGGPLRVPAVDAVMGSSSLRDELAADREPADILAGWRAQVG